MSVVVASGAVVVSAVTAESSGKSAQASQQQVDIAQQGQLNDRFDRAVQQLGNRDSIDIRQGGIHALESLLEDSSRHHPTILKLLASFVREHSPVPECAERKRVPEDIRAAIGVIGRHNIRPDTRAYEYSIDLRNTCLSGIDLVGLDFARGYFAGADLSGSNLTGADFTGAYLLRANLGRVIAEEANFTCAVLPIVKLDGAMLAASRLVGAELRGVDLTGAFLGAADLKDAILEGVAVEPKQLADALNVTPSPQPFCLTDGQYPPITRG